MGFAEQWRTIKFREDGPAASSWAVTVTIAARVVNDSVALCVRYDA